MRQRAWGPLAAALALADVAQELAGMYRWRPQGENNLNPAGWGFTMNCFSAGSGPYGQRKLPGTPCGGDSSSFKSSMNRTFEEASPTPGFIRHHVMFLESIRTVSNPGTAFEGHTGRTAQALFIDLPNGVRPNPLPSLAPAIWTQPSAVPMVVPQVDPFSLPIRQPVPAARPLPYKALPGLVPNPWRSPTEQPSHGPVARRGPRPAYPGQIDIKISPSGKVRTKASPGSKHRNKPPGKKDREKKAKANPASGSPLGRALSWATEGIEVVDAIYANLPPWAKGDLLEKGRKPTPQDKARAIMNNLDQVDWAGALADLLANQVEDAVIGRIGRAAGAAAGKTFGPGGFGPQGRPAGFQAGPAM